MRAPADHAILLYTIDPKEVASMKKLCAFLLMALLMVPVWAGADDLVLPDPGYYFGREYNGSYIEFDEYPYAEYNAYVSLLVNQYGMQIMSAYSGESDEFYFLQMPGTEYTRTFIWCYQYSDGCGIEAYFDNGISLEPLDVYGQRPDAEEPAEEKSAAKGQIAWDDGRMIADPGDFLGYKIKTTERIDKLNSYKKGYVSYKYEAIDMDDLQAYIAALDESPYFRRAGSMDSKWYQLIYFVYTGPDKQITQKDGTAEWNSNLSVMNNEPNSSCSDFYIYEYPGFTVNSKLNSEREDHDQAGDSCSFCGGDGKCDECGGDNWVWAWEWVYVDGAPRQEQVNQLCKGIYCNGGSCSKCGGDGVR